MQPRPVRLVPQLVPQLVPDAASHVAPATAAPIAMGSHGSSMAPRMVMGSMGLVSAAVACRKHRKLSGIRSVNANLTRCRAEGEADPLLAEAKAAAEAAKLQLEAAKLRAEADELRKATATAQRKERAVRILGSDEVMGIGLPELMARLQEEGTELTGEQGLALAQAMGFQEEPYFFRLEDLASEAFDKKLSAIQAENVKARQAEAKKREEERANQAANAANAASSTTVSPEMGEVVNDDRSLGPRLTGSLAYILPLTEAFKFMLPLVQQFHPLGVIFGPITLLTVLLNTIPFIPLILFVTFIIFAQVKDIPRLVRFNLEQAVLIDMALTLPSFILSTLEFSGNLEVASILGGLTFALTFGISVYAVLCNLDGKDPDGVPLISNVTKNVVDRGTFFDPPKEDNK
ncbi:unnamed protein product [Cladocopium goreaui]|uniref:Tic20 family protein n=1 Tax=Cladocopium goreaui TaxID=2562237 RepID=A0A9P1CLG0_9DINO|nr:unnamed protein product [Cladocopium goreaui]